MSLWDEISRAAFRSVAVFGMAKNAGKTVALNHLARRASEAGRALGLTSIGRDGETWDVITHQRKPAVRVLKGDLVATAERCLGAGTAVLEIVEETWIQTPLGGVVVARVEKAGHTELAGPGRVAQLKKVVKRLESLGSDMVLVDGAIDRKGLASPRVTEGCVLATGAVLSEVMEEVVRKTRLRVRQITLPVASVDYAGKFRRGSVVVLDGGRQREIPNESALKGRMKLNRAGREGTATLLVDGALTDPMLRGLIGKGVRIVVRDATHVFAEDSLLDRFLERGGLLEAVSPIRLAGVTVNPFSPEGWSFDPGKFLEAVSSALPGVPVFDVLQERK